MATNLIHVFESLQRTPIQLFTKKSPTQLSWLLHTHSNNLGLYKVCCCCHYDCDDGFNIITVFSEQLMMKWPLFVKTVELNL